MFRHVRGVVYTMVDFNITLSIRRLRHLTVKFINYHKLPHDNIREKNIFILLNSTDNNGLADAW